MIAESRGREHRFVDTNLFVYAHDESAGHKRETARGSSRSCGSRANSEDLNAVQSYDGVRI